MLREVSAQNCYIGGTVTGEILERLKALDEEELAALSDIMDHKIQHRLTRKIED